MEFCRQGAIFRLYGLPFDISTACYYVTKLLRLLVKKWRSMSHNCFVYLDDGILGLREHVSACVANSTRHSDSTGIVSNKDKSNLEPRLGLGLG